MSGILINGNFLCRALTGVERFAYETVSRMDNMLGEGDDVAFFAPSNSSPPQYKHIRIIKSVHPLRSFPLWDMVQFANALKSTRRIALSFSNTAPLGRRCGLSFIHDVYCKDYPNDFVSLHEKAVALYTDFCCRNISHNALKIITVSDFSKRRIMEQYKVSPNRISIVTNGWEHFQDVERDDSVFSRFPSLHSGGFYFTLGSLQKRKNLLWVLSYAKCHSRDVFAIAGAAVRGFVTGELSSLSSMSNVVMTGRLTDGEVKAMMASCKAFLFPSLYEGFGIPPLEALSCGARVVVSDIPVFHEIYGDAVHYIEAHDAACDIDALLSKPVSSPATVLESHSYNKAAAQLLAIIRETNITQSPI